MSIFYRNMIVGSFWLMLIALLITSQTTSMLLALLFTVFVLNLSEFVISTKIKNTLKKIVGFVLSVTAISLIGWGVYVAFSAMISDFNSLINSSHGQIISTANQLGLEVTTLQEIQVLAIDFIKENTGFLVVTGSLLIKVFLGVILGIIIHFSPLKQSDQNVWGSVLNTILSQSQIFFESFKNIMAIQVLISLMNTAIIAFMSTVFTWLIFGEFLPYWYVLILLTAVLSLVPVVGNMLINIILVLSTIQMSPFYVLVGLGLFAIIHKLELLVIGKQMDSKVGIPFIVILFSMVIGKLLFNSMSGMILGMVTVVTVAQLLKNKPLLDNVGIPVKR